ncbi:MAG TPA: sialate O-acetylesterase [Kofleriaceae bacterium]|nr:sialate O-acetylesterase [Kofleriaceae bacterium]
MKRAILLLAAGCAGEPDRIAAALGDGDPVTVFVIAGQSNAAGGAAVDDLPPELAWYAEPVEALHAYELNAPKDYSGAPAAVSTGWLPEVAPRYGTGLRMGVEVSAVRRLIELHGPDVAILKHATNGSNLFAHWDPDRRDGLYAYLVRYLDARLAELPAGSRVGGLIWIQGNGDAAAPLDRADDYGDNLAVLVTRFRERYGPIPVAIDWFPAFFEEVNADVVRAGQLEVAATVPDVALIDADDLGPARDSPGAHYTAAAFVELGLRMADALRERAPR